MPDKPFISWDSEGYDTATGKHKLNLWGNSLDEYITGEGLTTHDCLYLLWSCHTYNAINVIFSGTYDVNMILGDLDNISVDRLYDLGKVHWNGWTIEYRPRKWFKVTRNHKTVTLWDVFTFFGKSLTKTIAEYLGNDYPDLPLIIQGKSDRSDFKNKDLENDILPYWRAEHKALIAIMDKLRDYLYQVGVITSRWHGPGAVASVVLQNRHIDQHKERWDDASYDAIRSAYFGGRSESARIGTYHGGVWRYDIRSAWPAGLAEVPSLAGKEWYDVPTDSDIQNYDLVHVQWHNLTKKGQLNALPHRNRAGLISFPKRVSGWYWGVEVKAAIQWTESSYVINRIARIDDNGSRPLAWIKELYDTRAMWKRQGIQAQLALKLVMNSLYGKFAQQIGGSIDHDGNVTIPKWHQLDWAGYATAQCRAQLLHAISLAGQDTITVETDAIFSTKRLPLNVGSGLGMWEETRHDGICYLQTGLYFLNTDGQWKAKSRGLDLMTDNDPEAEPLTIDNTLEYLSHLTSHEIIADQRGKRATSTRFRTMGTARGTDKWRTWERTHRFVTTGITGKRTHDPYCRVCPTSMAEALHTTVSYRPGNLESNPHNVLWRPTDYWQGELWDEQDPLWSWEDD